MHSFLLFNANPLPFLYVIPTSTDLLISFDILLRSVNTMPDFQIETLLNIINRIFLAFLTCAFTLGGALIGIIIDVIKGQTMETGLVRGASVGESSVQSQLFSKGTMIVNGEGEGVMLSTPVSPNVEELNIGKKAWEALDLRTETVDNELNCNLSLKNLRIPMQFTNLHSNPTN